MESLQEVKAAKLNLLSCATLQITPTPTEWSKSTGEASGVMQEYNYAALQSNMMSLKEKWESFKKNLTALSTWTVKFHCLGLWVNLFIAVGRRKAA